MLKRGTTEEKNEQNKTLVTLFENIYQQILKIIIEKISIACI